MSFSPPVYPTRISIVSQQQLLVSCLIDYELIYNYFDNIESHVDCIKKSQIINHFMKNMTTQTFSINIEQNSLQTSYICFLKTNPLITISMRFTRHQNAKIVIF